MSVSGEEGGEFPDQYGSTRKLTTTDGRKTAPDSLSGGRRVEYDAALSAAGFGRFQYWLVLTIGWANAADAVELLSVSSLLPAAECDLQMTAEQKGYLTASSFIGLMVGGCVWGGLGDAIGRKATLVSALLFNAFFGLVSSLMQSFWPFLACRFLSGVGVGGATPLVFAYFSEFSPSEYRGRMIAVVSYFWIIGNTLVAGMAWLMIPADIGWTEGPFKYNSWRIFVLFATLPSFLSALALTRFPRSPKFLLAEGRDTEALEILREVHRINAHGKVGDYPVSSLEQVRHEDSRRRQSAGDVLRVMVGNVADLFRTCLRPLVVLLGIEFAIQFGYYGLWVWFPELFNRLEQYQEAHPSAAPAAMCDIIDASVNGTAVDPCAAAASPSAYMDEFIVAAAPALLNMWTIFHMDKLGRKFFLVIGLAMSSGSVFFIYLVKKTWQNLALSCLFGSVSNLSFSAINCVSAELFPTHLRSTAIAVLMLVARIGAIAGQAVFGELLYLNCAIPILMVAALLMGGALLSCLLPKTDGAKLPE